MDLCPTTSTRPYAYTSPAPPSLTAPYLRMPLRPVEDSEDGRGRTSELGVETGNARSGSRQEGTGKGAGGRNSSGGGFGGSTLPPPPFNADIASIVTAAVNAAIQGITTAATTNANAGVGSAQAAQAPFPRSNFFTYA